jgi:hypothetical protein
MVCIIPVKGDPTIQIAHPILCKGISCFDAGNQMINVFLVDILDAKIIDNKGE